MHPSIESVYVFTIIDDAYLKVFSGQNISVLFKRIRIGFFEALKAFAIISAIAALIIFIPNIPIIGLSTLVAVLAFQFFFIVGVLVHAYGGAFLRKQAAKDIAKIRGHPEWSVKQKLQSSSNLAVRGQKGAIIGALPHLFGVFMLPAYVLLGRSYVESGELLVFLHFAGAIFLDTISLGVVELYPGGAAKDTIANSLLSAYARATLTITLFAVFVAHFNMFPGHQTIYGNIYFAGRFILNHQFLTDFDDPDLSIVVTDPENTHNTRSCNGREFQEILDTCYRELVTADVATDAAQLSSDTPSLA